jgi:hypothetical protein
MGNLLRVFLSWYGNCEGDPLSPSGGGSPRRQVLKVDASDRY